MKRFVEYVFSDISLGVVRFHSEFWRIMGYALLAMSGIAFTQHAPLSVVAAVVLGHLMVEFSADIRKTYGL